MKRFSPFGKHSPCRYCVPTVRLVVIRVLEITHCPFSLLMQHPRFGFKKMIDPRLHRDIALCDRLTAYQLGIQNPDSEVGRML